MSKNILFKNNVFLSNDINAVEFLKSYPRGVYTTARTINNNNIFEFKFHINRLIESSKSIIPNNNTLFETLKDANKLKPVIVDYLEIASNEYKKLTSLSHDLKITILITVSNDKYDVYTHLTSLPPAPTSPVCVELRSAAREFANVKDSLWVIERQKIELEMPKYVNETLLCENNCVLEGMSSNFFALVENKDPLYPFAIMTAESNILKGSVRSLILDICKAENIPVILEAPNMNNMSKWKGAFITSTSRLLTPVNILYSRDSPFNPPPNSASDIINDRVKNILTIKNLEKSLDLGKACYNPIVYDIHPFIVELQKKVIDKIVEHSELAL